MLPRRSTAISRRYLLGGLGFAAAIFWAGVRFGVTDLQSLILCDGRITAFDSCGALADVARGKVYAVENTADLATPFHSMGPVTVDGKAYEKIISKAPLNAPALEPTVEDGYICFIEKLS